MNASSCDTYILVLSLSFGYHINALKYLDSKVLKIDLLNVCTVILIWSSVEWFRQRGGVYFCLILTCGHGFAVSHYSKTLPYRKTTLFYLIAFV